MISSKKKLNLDSRFKITPQITLKFFNLTDFRSFQHDEGCRKASADSPCVGCSSSMTTHFRHRCKVEGVAALRSCHGGRGCQRAGSGEVAVAHEPPSAGPSGRSRCPVARGCVPSAARPASSSPWPPAGSCHRSRAVRPGLRRRRHAGLSPGPSGRRGCGCAAPACHRSPLAPLLRLAGCQVSSPGACGRLGSDRSRCGRCCSTRHRSCGDQKEGG